MTAFKERYTELKQEGLTDNEVAKRLYISYSTLRRWKKRDGIKGKVDVMNKQGVTKEHFQQAEAIGLTRELVLRRVRAYAWDIEEAITTPKIPLNKRNQRRV